MAVQSGTFLCHGWQSLKKKKQETDRAVSVNASAAFADKFHSASTQVCSVWAVTSLSIRRSAYLMLGSSKVMAGLFFWKSSLKMRLMMLSKPPRINCDKRSNVGEWLRPPTPSISYQLSEYPAGRCLVGFLFFCLTQTATGRSESWRFLWAGPKQRSG